MVFREALGGGRVFFERDIGFYWYPQVESLVRALGEGAWPVWSPRFGFGAPMWADASHQIPYPITWLHLVLLPATYYKVFVIVHVMVAGVGGYVFARRAGLGSFASFAGAVAWCLSGPFLSATNLYHHFAAAAWMPWALFALHGALVRGKSPALLGAVVAMMVVAGSADVVLMTALLALFYSAAFVAGDAAGVGPRLRAVGRAGLIGAGVAAALSAVQWVPMAAQLRLGSRLALLPADNLYWSVHPASLVDLLVPRLLADFPLRGEAKSVLFEGRDPFLSTLYLGLPALAAVLFAPLHPARRLFLFAAISFAFFVLLALGAHTPLLPLLLHVQPMAIFRYPYKYLFPAALCWGVLTALGVSVWTGPWGARERRQARWVGAALLLAGLAMLAVASHPELAAGWSGALVEAGHEADAAAHVAFRVSGVAWMSVAIAAALAVRGFGSRSTEWAAVAVVALLAANLAGIARTVFLLAPRALLERRPALADVIAQGTGGHRVYSVRYPLDWMRAHLKDAPGVDPEWTWFLGNQERLTPPSGARWGIEGSYDPDFTGLVPKHVTRLVERFDALTDPRARTRLLQVAAVDYVVALVPPPAEGLRAKAALPSVYTMPIVLYAVPDPLAKVYLVGAARAMDDAPAVETLTDPAFDPRREVLLAADTPAFTGGDGLTGAVREVERRSDRIALDVEASQEALVVIVEAWAPEWTAAVDGVPSPVLRANTAFRAVRVPAGRHRVEMRYRPGAVPLGLAISLAAVAGLLVAWEVGRRRRESVPG